MLSSLLVALAITPWVSSKLLKDTAAEVAAYDVKTTATYRIYRRLVEPFVTSRGRSAVLMLAVAGLFGFSVFLALSGRVPLKMLPFDNKNELQIVVDLPEGSTLEATDAVVRDVEQYLQTVPEVVNFISTVGEGSPMDFNGLVRHYYLRQGPNMADVRINLLPRQQREMGSHALALRLRNDITEIARRNGALLKIVEAPPGPPVLSTVVAEIYGRPDQPYSELIAAAKALQVRMAGEEGVVDIDDTAEANQQKLFFRVDREKAGLNGIATEDVVNTLRIALSGMPAGTVHAPAERNELPIVLRLPREKRSDPERLKTIMVKGRMGNSVQLGELGAFEADVVEPTLFHKNMERVVFVTAEMAGRGPAYAVLDLQADLEKNPLPEGIAGRLDRRRRMEDHRGRVPRPRHRLLRRPAGDLRPAGLRDRLLPAAHHHHAVHPADHDRHHARLLAAERPGRPVRRRLRRFGLLHRHRHDRHDRPRRHRPAQRHHPDRLHPQRGRARQIAQGRHHRGRRRPLPPHLPHRRHHPARRVADHLRPHLQRAGLVDHLRPLRLHGLHPGRRPRRLRASSTRTSPSRRVEP